MEWPGFLRVMVPPPTECTNRKAKNTKSVVNTPGVRKHLYSLRSDEGMDFSDEHYKKT
ncbi:hypothetical protein YC2023_040736 [Brassica napus]